MKFNYKLYSIILLAWIVLICIYFLFKKEGFKNDFSDFNHVDRIMTSSINYAYCVAGDIICPDSSLNLIYDTYSDSKKGTTYNFLCNNQTPAICSGNFVSNLNGTDLNWKTPTAREINFPFSDMYSGFTIPYSYIPVDISGDYMNFRDRHNNVLDNVHKCEMLNSQSQTDDCYYQLQKAKDDAKAAADAAAKAAADAAAKANAADTGSGETSGDYNESDYSNSDYSSDYSSYYSSDYTGDNSVSKCIADYGTNIGDPLCCGQPGVLQYSAHKYICPQSAPTCSKYKCGETYGTCS